MTHQDTSGRARTHGGIQHRHRGDMIRTEATTIVGVASRHIGAGLRWVVLLPPRRCAEREPKKWAHPSKHTAT